MYSDTTTNSSKTAQAMQLLQQAVQHNEAARRKIAEAMRLLQAAVALEN